MPDLPQLAIVDNCPDCKAPVGASHERDCLVAICVTTGQQRVLHQDDAAPPTVQCIDIYPARPVEPTGAPCLLGCGIPPWRHVVPVDAHTCGEDVWVGYPHGSVTAASYGLFVRPATAADAPLTSWLPCHADEPGAVPDLDRLVRSGTWNPIEQVWELPAGATSC